MSFQPRFASFTRLITVAVSLGVVTTAHSAEILVSAAASLTNAFQDIGKLYEQKHPGDKLIFNFAASNPLLAQIQAGAPVDVFASADQVTMDRARDAKLLIDGTRRDFAANTLVLIVPAGSNNTPKSLADLNNAAYKRIAIGTRATVPAGRYAAEAIEKEKLADGLQSKFIFGESVRQVLNYVARNEVDAGFVYGTDAAVEKDKVRVTYTVPTDTRVTYPIAQVSTGKNAAGGKTFLDFLNTKEAQDVLDRAGFVKP